METLEPSIGTFYAGQIGLALPRYTDTRDSEFNVQAELYGMLKRNGFEVHGEVLLRGRCTHFGRRERFQLRLDLVVYHANKAAHIVEVKARPVKHKNGLENTRQARRYMALGVPVTFVYGMDDCYQFMRYITEERSKWLSL